MCSWIRSLFAKSNHTIRRQPTKLGVESLAAREMPAGVTSGLYLPGISYGPTVSFDQASGVVTINGDSAANTVNVSTSQSLALNLSQLIVTSDNLLTPTVSIPLYRTTWFGTTPNVKQIVFHGGDGGDTFTNNTSYPSTAYGDGGNDLLQGGSAADYLDGGAGDDNLRGGAGDDVMYGGTEDDQIGSYWQGNVWMDDPGNNEMHGGAGNDTLSGSATGRDVMYGDAGNDSLWGSGGYDTLDGGVGNDSLYGQAGYDKLYGGDDNDYLSGGINDDLLNGGNGNDTLVGGDGNDTLGAYWSQGTWVDDPNDDVIRGGIGNDTLAGGSGDDRLFGEQGNDDLWGDSGNDQLFGGAFADPDTMHGGTGADTFLSIYAEDTTFDKATEDARVTFSSDGVSFWQDSEIQTAANGMWFLQNQTRSAKLMKMANGNEFEVQRVASIAAPGPGLVTLGDNNNAGKIRITDAGAPTVDVVIVHEIGHNWDDEGFLWNQWKSVSGWQPHNNGGGSLFPPYGYSLSTDGKWDYLSSTGFARDYGKWNPMEDWSTCWELYYQAHTSNPNNPAANPTYAALHDKMLKLDAFFAYVG